MASLGQLSSWAHDVELIPLGNARTAGGALHPWALAGLQFLALLDEEPEACPQDPRKTQGVTSLDALLGRNRVASLLLGAIAMFCSN